MVCNCVQCAFCTKGRKPKLSLRPILIQTTTNPGRFSERVQVQVEKNLLESGRAKIQKCKHNVKVKVEVKSEDCLSRAPNKEIKLQETTILWSDLVCGLEQRVAWQQHDKPPRATVSQRRTQTNKSM